MDDDARDPLDVDDEESWRDDPDEKEPFGFCRTPGCVVGDMHVYPSECTTAADLAAWDAYCRAEERRERWPRLYALIDGVRRVLRARPWRAWKRLPKEEDDGVPF